MGKLKKQISIKLESNGENGGGGGSRSSSGAGSGNLFGGLVHHAAAKLTRRASESSPAIMAKMGVGTHSTSAHNQVPVQTIKCVVTFLDDSRHVFEVDRLAKGEELLEMVFTHLELIERDYFSLQFNEIVPSSSSTLNGVQNGLLATPTSTNGSSSAALESGGGHSGCSSSQVHLNNVYSVSAWSRFSFEGN